MRWLDGITNSMDMSFEQTPGESEGQESLMFYSPWGCKGVDMTETEKQHTHTHTLELQFKYFSEFLKLAVILAGYPLWGLPTWCSGKEPTCPCRRHKRHGLDPWVEKIPWRRTRQPTPVFLSGKPQGQRSPVGYHPMGCKELGLTEATQRASMHTYQQNSNQLKLRRPQSHKEHGVSMQTEF